MIMIIRNLESSGIQLYLEYNFVKKQKLSLFLF